MRRSGKKEKSLTFISFKVRVMVIGLMMVTVVDGSMLGPHGNCVCASFSRCVQI